MVDKRAESVSQKRYLAIAPYDNQMIQVYFDAPAVSASNEEFLMEIEDQTPGSNGEWDDIKAVTEPSEASYHIGIDSLSDRADPDKSVVFCVEPPARYKKGEWESINALKKFHILDHYKPQFWWVDKSYDELIDVSPMQKEHDLSWITTDKGLHINYIIKIIRGAMLKTGFRKYRRKGLDFLDSGIHDGHIIRMKFYKRCQGELDNCLHLYGRGNFQSPFYRGELDDKWDGLESYRYTLAFENSKIPNYFTEKICDALLSWTMPIYWGCTNIDEFLPERSYVRLDIEDPNAPQRVKEIVNSNLREQNLDAIAEARRRILKQYQIWPTVNRIITQLDNCPTSEFDTKLGMSDSGDT